MPLFENNFSRIPKQPISNKTIVLDLDNTLIFSYTSTSGYKSLKVITDSKNVKIRNRIYRFGYPDNNKIINVWGIKRPFLREFLYFCFCYFKKVCVWSAGQRDYVDKIVNEIFKEFRKPDVVWARGDCVDEIVIEKAIENDEEIMNEVQKIYKPLTKLCKEYPDISLEEMYIIDDNKGTFIFNEYNAINIPYYAPEPTLENIKKKDPSLLQIANWLMLPEVINCNDIRNLDKTKIFNTNLVEYSNLLNKHYDELGQ